MVCLQSLHSVGVVTSSFYILILCPFRFVFIFVSFFFLPLVCYHLYYMCCGFVQIILHIILHGLLFVFFVFVLFDITWCMCYGDCRLCFGGGSYSAVYVPPPLYMFPMVPVMYIPSFFPCYVLCTYFLILICP